MQVMVLCIKLVTVTMLFNISHSKIALPLILYIYNHARAMWDCGFICFQCKSISRMHFHPLQLDMLLWMLFVNFMTSSAGCLLMRKHQNCSATAWSMTAPWSEWEILQLVSFVERRTCSFSWMSLRQCRGIPTCWMSSAAFCRMCT